jgi:hypothetical protein
MIEDYKDNNVSDKPILAVGTHRRRSPLEFSSY